MQLEEHFLAAVVASERVERWLDALRAFKRARGCGGAAPLVRAKQALRELVAALDSEAYVDEARQAGAVPLLTSLLKLTDDEDLLNDVSDALAACSGLMATSGKVTCSALWSTAITSSMKGTVTRAFQARGSLLAGLVAPADAEELHSLAVAVLAACSGGVLSQTRTFTYGDYFVVLKEGALGDGTGAKVWTSSHTLCREMVVHPEIVSDCRVLEIGSGCGGCGILAAKLGAAEVVLTDYSDPVLRNLRDCVQLNAAGSAAINGAAANQGAVADSSEDDEMAAAAAAEQRRQRLAEAEAWDPEDASECGSDDFDDILGEALGNGCGCSTEAPRAEDQRAAAAEGPAASWDATTPPMRIRYYDWQDSFAQLGNEERAALLGVPGVPRTAAVAPGASIDTASNDSGAPGLDASEQFDVIIGTDIMYEWQMVLLVPSVIKHRLRPGGRALLCCAVREKAMFAAALGALAALRMRASMVQVQPAAEDILDIKQEYEGGYVLVAVEHAESPALDWHRDDLMH